MFKDITGQRSSRLVAIRRLDVRKESSRWLCVCDCGNEKIIRLGSFTRPNLSCGCLHSEIQRKRLTKHGMARTPEYHAWQAMHQRCKLPHHPEFKNYGARGIRVCEGWVTFPPFFASLGLRPSPGLSIDRKDNNGNYSCGKCAECKREGWPMNCRWATTQEQSDNRRPTRMLVFQDRVMTIAAWARETGLTYKALSARIEDGWTTERALTTPLMKRRGRTLPQAPC